MHEQIYSKLYSSFSSVFPPLSQIKGKKQSVVGLKAEQRISMPEWNWNPEGMLSL